MSLMRGLPVVEACDSSHCNRGHVPCEACLLLKHVTAVIATMDMSLTRGLPVVEACDMEACDMRGLPVDNESQDRAAR